MFLERREKGITSINQRPRSRIEKRTPEQNTAAWTQGGIVKTKSLIEPNREAKELAEELADTDTELGSALLGSLLFSTDDLYFLVPPI